MPVEHQRRMVLVQQLMEHREATVRQVAQIAVAVQRRMGHQHIQTAGALDFSPQAADAFAHLRLGELPRAVAVSKRAAQPGDEHPLVDVHIIINTQRPAGRVLVIAFIVVSVYIDQRHVGHGG